MEIEQELGLRVFGPAHMRMIELPLSVVTVDPAFNCRAPYTDAEVAEACAAFEKLPMLHPPAIARVGEGWLLIAGFLRFAVWQVKGIEVGVFRWVEADDMRELALTNLAENLMRSDLRPREIVETAMKLHEAEYRTEVIAQYCRRSPRWVRRLCRLKRKAHPQLWEAFVAGTSPHLTLARMLDLADHPPDAQLRRWQMVLDAGERADEHARGYAEGAADPTTGASAGGPRPAARPRRRYPPRRQVRQLRRVLEHEPTVEPSFRKGALAILDWLLLGKELPINVSLSRLSAVRSATREARADDAAVEADDSVAEARAAAH